MNWRAGLPAAVVLALLCTLSAHCHAEGSTPSGPLVLCDEMAPGVWACMLRATVPDVPPPTNPL